MMVRDGVDVATFYIVPSRCINRYPTLIENSMATRSHGCVNCHTDDRRKVEETASVSGENVMCPRNERERRMDRLSADRFDLAVLTARAFDLDAAITYLSLAGVSTALIDRFAKDYPDRLRATAITSHAQRRRRRTD
jgi:hypothetical protein